VIKNHVPTANPAALLKIARPSRRGFRALLRTSDLMKVFALTSRRQSRGNRASRKATIACAAQRRFVACPNFGENRCERDHHDFFRAHAREMCPQIAKTEVNCCLQLHLSRAQKCARLRKSAHFCAPEGVRNRWQSGRLQVLRRNLPTVPDTAFRFVNSGCCQPGSLCIRLAITPSLALQRIDAGLSQRPPGYVDAGV